MIRLAPGEIYLNRTRKYLAPIVNNLGDAIITSLSSMTVQAWGIYDALYLDAKGIDELRYHLFILANPRGPYDEDKERYQDPTRHNKIFVEKLDIIRRNPKYIDDYPFTLERRQHMIILRLPKEYRTSYDEYLQGNFSKMYTKMQLNKIGIRRFISDGKLNVVYEVLTKSTTFHKRFNEKVNALYRTTIELQEDVELDSFGIDPRHEAFNTEDFLGVTKHEQEDEKDNT